MADTDNVAQLQQQEQHKSAKQKQVIAEKVSGTVKWFNVKSGYGFINRNDTKEDVFVHQTAIIRNNPRKAVRSVGDGEVVEFAVVAGEKGCEAAGVTGPGGEPVKGSPYAADKRRGYYRQYYPRGGGRGGEGTPRRGGMGRRGPPPNQGGAQGDEIQEGGNVAPPQRSYNFRRNFRGGRRGGSGPMNRGGGYRRPRPRNYQQGQGSAQGQNHRQSRGEGEDSAGNESPNQQQEQMKNNKVKNATVDSSSLNESHD
uniref:CSD domain-containing protein n=1 Tax=Lonomia obliqua TaxID=304329 RepID=Q5MGM1_LONON|nr:hypothetical protein 18 [Lonomia obliqua]